MPSFEPEIRVEVYVPIRYEPAYQDTLTWLIEEFTELRGGCTVNAAVDLWIELDASFGGQGHRIESRDLGISAEHPKWPDEGPAGLSWVWRVLNRRWAEP